MKLRPVILNFQRETQQLWELDDDDIMLANCDIVIFPIYGQFGAMWKPDSGCMVCKTYIFIKSILLSYKTENRIKKFLTQLSYYYFE